MKKIIILSLMLLGIDLYAQKSITDYVDNFIGVRDQNSSTVLGPQLPNGSINPSPHTNPGRLDNDMDGYVPGEPIRGFAQLHVSGTGWGKYGQFLISPQVGLAVGEADHDSPAENETAKPYEYGVTLKRYNIRTDFTPSAHSAIYKIVFPKTENANILIDVTHQLGDIATVLKAEFLDGEVKFSGSKGDQISGYGYFQGGFSRVPYRVYFCMRLSKAPKSFGTWLNGNVSKGKNYQKSTAKNDRIGAYAAYDASEKETVFAKIAVSFKSNEQAQKWLDSEIPDWNYDAVKKAAVKKWEEELSKIKIKGGTEPERRIFYSALYHTSIMPRNRTNDFEDYGQDVPVWDDHFAVWDTWRTLFPLKALIDQDMVSGTINSFIARYKKTGEVKDAFVAGKDMSVEQGGNDIDNIIADAFVKNVKGVNWNEAYDLIKFHATEGRKGIYYNQEDRPKSEMYKQLGWIPAGKMSNSVSLEYYYNDFCASQLARKLGTKQEYEVLAERSGKWTNLWNENAESDGFRGFIVPKDQNGNFVAIDVKKNWGSWKDYFYEGNSWTYSYFVPHQFDRLVAMSPSKEKFCEKLKYGFDHNLIDYGNEPAFLAVQSFHYADRSDLASFYIRKLMKERFTEDGYSENDDSGAMSSWYIFSALGFFPNAGQDLYYLNGPSFPEATVKLSNNKILRITAKNADSKNIYIQSCRINGKTWNKFWFSHKDIQNGGTIEFVMGSKPGLK